MKPRILENARIPPLEAALAREYDVHPLWKEADAAAFLREHGREFTGLVTGSLKGASGELIDAMPNLQVIANYGVGYDTIDLGAARRRGVAVSTTPDVLTDCVADFAFGLLIATARQHVAADRFVRDGEWKPGVFFRVTTRVARKRLGVLGLGRIGQAIAQRSTGFGMEVRYHSRRPVAQARWTYEPSLRELAAWCDFLVVACAGGEATRHLVNAEVLDALGPHGFIVNIARGTVIDEAALVAALKNKRIAGAGLDVFEHEPNVPRELLEADNVVLAPHTASGTQETRREMGELVLDNLRSWYRDGRLLTPVA
ncbi:2-hydroxyacid dehydrogenase [Ramlibacter sp.]|uniref:2-hydroxyacid dehydrogenase n=1 Tax=Ramlibacter sp. TaxID=1917967 RepID=UPI003D0CE223